MIETHPKTSEIIPVTDEGLQQYAEHLVALLDVAGDDFSGLPGKAVEFPTEVDGKNGTRRVVMGVTEPYPKRSPRFGAIMNTNETQTQHFVVSDGMIDSRSHGGTHETLGYAITDVRDEAPSRLMVSRRPRFPNSWREVKPTDKDYESHVLAFLELTDTVVGNIEPNLATGLAAAVKRKDELQTAIADKKADLARAAAEADEAVENQAKAIGTTAEELPELHDDQLRIIALLEKLDRKHTVQGDKIPRRDRKSRSEHKQTVEKARRSLEVQYGIKASGKKVGSAVIESVLGTEAALRNVLDSIAANSQAVDVAEEDIHRTAAEKTRIATIEEDLRGKQARLRALKY